MSFRGSAIEAIVEYGTAIASRPNCADAHNSIAWALVKKPDCSAQERSEALEHARQAVVLVPKDGDFRTTLALAEYRAGHWRESIAAADRSIGLTKGVNAVNWFLQAMAHWQNGDQDRSGSCFEQAVSWTQKNEPKDAALLAFWREAAELLGQPDPSGSAPLPDLPAELFAP